ncbi:nuclear transport factor 2 family protein [Winogradskyella sp. DF17]|jgi:hypothetical protein|uniref:Nuclear transport factor 2 family protein n=1 Tax=Winogradskyella pelagia TaxID=2819984 RepID=A0ABS3T400_9FLAO|nr:nuclear transport factor 2 family protein [Winogradskyella sp. DF17]MBO3117470.1 nuclear transport factor 2 family protein [Winogradskyella sp. DF17]
MKYLVFILLTFYSVVISAQNSESNEVKQVILNFFEAFHQQDSTELKKMVTKDIVMQSIGKDQAGKTILNITDFNKFVSSIASIPKENSFEEKLLDFSIQIDGDMANAWTPYEFWYNGSFSHCGVNSFQLMRLNGIWKIIYLVDTRRKTDCKKF